MKPHWEALVGISYDRDSKDKKHECIIESMRVE